MTTKPNRTQILAAIRGLADGEADKALAILEGFSTAPTTTVSTRVSAGTARALAAHARTLKSTPAAILRAMIEKAARSSKDRKRLTDLLGLDQAASDQEVTAAVAVLVNATSTTGGTPPDSSGGTAGNADPPPAPSAFGRTLTRAELAYIAKHKITAAEFQARKRAAVKGR